MSFDQEVIVTANEVDPINEFFDGLGFFQLEEKESTTNSVVASPQKNRTNDSQKKEKKSKGGGQYHVQKTYQKKNKEGPFKIFVHK